VNIRAQDNIPIKSTILDESKLSIFGTSNVTDFQCLNKEKFKVETLTHSLTIDNETVLVSGDTLKLQIDNFDCGRKGINKDFRKTLQSDEYPDIDISLLSFKTSSDLLEEVNIQISLAGTDKKYKLEFTSTYQEDGTIKIEGEQKLAMTDFNIDPPKALFGLIKVRDELVIKFTLFLKTL